MRKISPANASLGVLSGRSRFIPFLTMVFFTIFYLLSLRAFPGGQGVLLAITVLSAFSMSAALFYSLSLSRYKEASLLCISILLVFGYVKFIWILYFPASMESFYQPSAWSIFRSSEFLSLALAIQAVATAGFSTAVVLGTYLSARYYGETVGREFPAGNPSKAHFLMLLILLAAVHFLVAKFKVGFMGGEPVRLPFHLTGVLHYSNTIILPALILTQVFMAYRARDVLYSRLGLALLLAWAVSDTVLRTSRGSLFLAPLLVVFLAVSGGMRLKKSEKASLLGVLLAAVLCVPLISGYRQARGMGRRGLSGTVLTMNELSSSIGKYRFYSKGVTFAFLRIPGIETLTAILGKGGAPLKDRASEVLRSRGGVSGYVTRVLFSIPGAQGLSTGLLGGMYLLGGTTGVFLAFFIMGLLATVVWEQLARLQLAASPVIKAFLLYFLFSLMTEGSVNTFVRQIPFALVAFMVSEAIVRRAALRVIP